VLLANVTADTNASGAVMASIIDCNQINIDC